MKVKVYSYKKCSTCQKALKFLTGQGIEADVVDITEQPPTKTELKSMLKSYEGEVKRLFNTSGVIYREMGLKDKLPEFSDSEAIELLASEGKLVKRPFLLVDEAGKKVGKRVGFKEAEWKSLLSN